MFTNLRPVVNAAIESHQPTSTRLESVKLSGKWFQRIKVGETVYLIRDTAAKELNRG